MKFYIRDTGGINRRWYVSKTNLKSIKEYKNLYLRLGGGFYTGNPDKFSSPSAAMAELQVSPEYNCETDSVIVEIASRF